MTFRVPRLTLVEMMARETWKDAARECLKTALARLDELTQTCDEPKVLMEVIKTVSDLVGTAEMLDRASAPEETVD